MARQPSVVFLPGIMGSRLYFPKSGLFWDPDSPSRMLGWVPTPLVRSSDYLRSLVHVREPAGLLVDPAKGAATAEQVRRGWGTVSWEFYGPILTRLENEYGPQVHAVGYDWRQSLRRLGLYVGDKLRRIRETSGSDRLIIVTHSMGGLVARATFAVAPDLKDKIAGVVYVCQPAVGSVTLYRRMFTGLSPEFDATPEGGFSGRLFDRIFALILGGNRQDFLGKLSGMPGAVSLLPNDHYPRMDAGVPWLPELTARNSALELFDSPASPPGLMPAGKDRLSIEVAADLSARLDEFGRTQALLGPPDDKRTHHPNTWIVHGDGLPTETRVTRKGAKFVADKSLRGDGTVPSASATALPVQRDRVSSVNGLEHSAAFSDKTTSGEACIRKTIEYVKKIAAANGSATHPADPLASFAVIGELDETSRQAKLAELVASDSAAGVGPASFSGTFALPFGALDWLRIGRDDPWRHMSHVFGYIPAVSSGAAPFEILPASAAPKMPQLMTKGLRVTLDRLYVASYPGGGTHHVLFNFSVRNRVDGGKHEELVHFNAIYETRDREHAAVQGLPIFVCLNVGQEGLVLKCRTLNVKNDEDERLIAFLNSDTFRGGLKLASTIQPAVGQLSESAVAIFKFLAGRSRNVGVQHFELGLDFSQVATHGRLAEGSYLAVQHPGPETPGWKWSDWAFDPDSGRIFSKARPDEPFGFNYVILGVSGLPGEPSKP